jgi:hypothetical protein
MLCICLSFIAGLIVAGLIESNFSFICNEYIDIINRYNLLINLFIVLNIEIINYFNYFIIFLELCIVLNSLNN